MRHTTALILLAALAACGSGQKANNAAAAAPAANASAAPAPAPTANAAEPAAAARTEAAGVAEFREETYRGCVEGGQESAPPGTPVAQICTCATDRAMAGRSLAQLEAEPTADFERRFRGDVDACVDAVGG